MKNLCASAIKYFISLDQEKKKLHQLKSNKEVSILPLEDIEGGIQDLEIISKRFKFTTEDEFEVLIEEINQNLYQVRALQDPDVFFECFIQPEKSKWIQTDIKDFHTHVKYNVLYIDPPWILNGKDPVRGPSLKFKCLKLNEIKRIQLTKEGIIHIWVINKYFHEIIKWINYLDLMIIHILFWIKTLPSGKLYKGIGHYVQHSSELFLILSRSKIKLTNVKGINSHCLFAKRRMQSQNQKDYTNILN